MSRSRFGLVFALLGTLTLWGCAQNPSASMSAAAKATRLQEEIHGLTAQRDQLRQDLRSVNDEKEKLQNELDQLRLVVKERDELKQNLATRTSERDQTVTQMDQLRKGMKSLIEQVEAALPPSSNPVSSTTPAKPAGQS